MKKIIIAAMLTVLSPTAEAACPAQTITITLSTAGGPLSATKCISNADITALQTAFASPLIASGIAVPTPAQEWTAATDMLAQTLNSYVLQYAQGQAQATAKNGVTFTGAQ